MTNSLDLSSIFNVYSMRERPPNNAGQSLPSEFRNRVWLFCTEMVHPYDHYSRTGYKIADFWMTLRDKLRYKQGRVQLTDRGQPTVIMEVEAFLLKCSDEDYLDFIEMFFQSEDLPKYFSDSELKEAVGNINRFFTEDDLPYSLTEFSISKSKTLKPRINRLLFQLFGGFRFRWSESPWVKSSHMQPKSHPIRIPTIEAYPQIIRRDSQLLHQTAIQPALELLSNPAFRSANLEFLGALSDFRNKDYADCVVKCGSAFESVMKVICDQKKWPYKQTDTTEPLLNAIFQRAGLEPFFKQPIMLVATIRNRLSSAHGSGAKSRVVPKHVANYSINATASAILLLVEETNP